GGGGGGGGPASPPAQGAPPPGFGREAGGGGGGGQGGAGRGGGGAARGGGGWRGLPERGTEEFEGQVARVRAGFPRLSRRQAEIALGVWGGLSEDECAGWLGIATDTVHTHCRGILVRLAPLGITRRGDVIRHVERHFNRDPGGEEASPEEG